MATEHIPFPNKKYNIIYADPPWSYYNDSDAKIDCTTIKGMRRPPYNVLGSESIKKIPVNNISDKKSILFIWTTDYHLEKCLEIIKSWGFQYKTIGFVWSKRNKNGTPVRFCGAYTMKSGVELCLLATKGNQARKLLLKHNVPAYLESQREHHSKKPDEIRKRIDELFGNIKKIELFARQKTDGWDVWGNEV
jgi:site-specific DNA-methyltransferase (adenine-specific)